MTQTVSDIVAQRLFHEDIRAQARAKAAAKQLRDQLHEIDPDVLRYRAEKARKVGTPQPVIEAAKAEYEALQARDAERAKGGRPKNRQFQRAKIGGQAYAAKRERIRAERPEETKPCACGCGELLRLSVLGDKYATRKYVDITHRPVEAVPDEKTCLCNRVFRRRKDESRKSWKARLTCSRPACVLAARTMGMRRAWAERKGGLRNRKAS